MDDSPDLSLQLWLSSADFQKPLYTCLLIMDIQHGCCEIMGYIDARSSWHRVPKTLGNFWVIGASFVLTRWLLVGTWIASEWELDTRKTKPWLEVWNFQPPPPPHPWGRREGLEIELIMFKWWRLHKNSPKYRAWRASRLVNIPNTGRVVHPNSVGQKLLCSGPSQITLLASLQVAVQLYHLLYNKLVSVLLWIF